MLMTGTTARRLSVLTFALCVSLYAGAIAFEFPNAAETPVSSWGSGGRFVMLAFALGIICFPLVGVLITRRSPGNPIGWLLLSIGVLWSWSAFADSYVLYAVRTRPGSLPGAALMGASEDWIWVPAVGLMGTFLILLFPNGHLPSRRWRFVAYVSVATLVVGSVSVLLRPGKLQDISVRGLTNPLGAKPLEGLLNVLSTSLFVLPLCIIASAVALIARFRRSHGVERLQLKWLATAATFVASIYMAAMVGTFSFDSSPPAWVLVLQDAALVSFGVIPIAIGVAVLKHRLYGIDLVINKALVFGVLASFITAVYVAIVVGVGSLVGRANRPSLALSIAATALVAVAFQPVRDRVQRVANRLVYGTRATPYEVLSNFADRMGGTYDAAELLPMMARTVAVGVGATSADVWLAIGPELRREASWSSLDDPAPDQPVVAGHVSELAGSRVVPIVHDGELLGAITVVKPAAEPITPAEGKLLDDVAAQAGLVLRNVRLIEELRSSRQRLVSAQDEERRRLERNLHDGAQQSLVAVALMLRMIRGRLSEGADPIGSTLDSASEQLALAIEELRELARGIHPAILSDRGLAAALSALVERSPCPVTLDYQLDERLNETVEGTLYFVVAEALTNVAKYADASEVTVTVRTYGDAIGCDVSDDGRGGADDEHGSGLRGLADRVAAVDGALEIVSPAGHGTRLTCRIPRRAAAVSAPVLPGQPDGARLVGVGQ